MTFTIWQADQNSFGSYCVRVLARLQQWRRTHPNSRLADLFGGATANPDTRALGYARTLKRLMMERGAPVVIATLHDGTPLVEISTTGQVFAAKVVHYAEDAGAAAIAERVRHQVEGPTRNPASPLCGLCLT